MRKNLLFFFLLLLGLGAQLVAQVASQAWQGYLRPDLTQDVQGAARYGPGPVIHPQPLTGGCAANVSIGSASNVFTQILSEANPIAVDNDLNTVLFLHRNNAGVFGGHSGNLRYDLSTNGGTTWVNDQGPVNPASVNGTNAARYPNVAIYNPAGNTNPSNAYLGYYAATVATTWNGTVSGVRRLNGAGNTENYNQPTATQTLIPRSLVKGAPGTFWTIDAVYNGVAIQGYRILKGVWNGSSDIVWSVNTTLNPTFNTAYDGNSKSNDFAIAFDPTGTTGWVCLITHLTTSPSPFTFYPVFYKTTNGGTTWTGPTTVDLGQFPCIASNIATGNNAMAAFDMDLTVDVYGNPHALMTVGNGDSGYGAFLGLWHAMFDVTMMDGVWNPMLVRNVYRGRGNYGTAPNNTTSDMEPQVARSADGTKIFYAWSDADSSVLLTTANQSPDLFARGYDVVNRKWTSAFNMTTCNANWAGKIFYPKMAETVLSNTGNYKLPIVFAEFGTNQDPINPANFHYLDSIWFAPSDFTINQCQATVNISPLDTIVSCSSVTLDAGPGAQAYAWSTGATTQAITVSSSGTYKVGLSNGCCTGSDSVVVVILAAPLAGFSSVISGYQGSFTNASTGSQATYLWDFGDGGSSTLANPSHTYASAGSYQVCLTVNNLCGSNTTCATVVISCPPAIAAWTSSNSGLAVSFNDQTSGTPTGWTWDFGDGSFSTLQNPTHTYNTAGIYTACLTITDACGADSTCQPVNACQLPSAVIQPMNGVYFFGNPIQFTDNSVGATAWFWDFGDGGTSTQQNPNYTFNQWGVFTTCLIASNACGSDTSCISLPILFDNVEDALAGQWSISPVPAKDWLSLSAIAAPAAHFEIKIFNALGQSVMAQEYQHLGGNLAQDFDVSALPSGVYFLEVLAQEGQFRGKFIKQ